MPPSRWRPAAREPVIAGQFGPVILRVVTVEPAAVTPLADVKEQLKQEIAESRAARRDRRPAQRDRGRPRRRRDAEEIATNYDLTLRTIPAIDASGWDADGTAIADLPGVALVAAIFESDVGLDNNPIAADKGYVWYAVTAVSEPRDRDLAEVRERVMRPGRPMRPRSGSPPGPRKSASRSRAARTLRRSRPRPASPSRPRRRHHVGDPPAASRSR